MKRPKHVDVKGKERMLNAVLALLESGYSVHIPYESEQIENETADERYYIIEFSHVKYDAPPFILEENEVD